jgi:hypothetical protein
MVVVMALPTASGDARKRILLYSTRALDLPSGQTAITKVPTQTLLSPTSTPVISTLEPSNTPANPVNSEPTNSQSQADRNQANDPISPVTVALIPVALLLLVVLGIVLRRAARVKGR